MKKNIFAAILAVGFAFGARAQQVNNIKLTDLKETYIEISQARRGGNGSVLVSVDYGQERNAGYNHIVKDQEGRNLFYNSLMAFVNVMSKNGYELLSVYNQSFSESAGAKHYVMKKINSIK